MRQLIQGLHNTRLVWAWKRWRRLRALRQLEQLKQDTGFLGRWADGDKRSVRKLAELIRRIA